MLVLINPFFWSNPFFKIRGSSKVSFDFVRFHNNRFNPLGQGGEKKNNYFSTLEICFQKFSYASDRDNCWNPNNAQYSKELRAVLKLLKFIHEKQKTNRHRIKTISQILLAYYIYIHTYTHSILYGNIHTYMYIFIHVIEHRYIH